MSVDYTEVLIAIITLFVAPATGVITWKMSKRKHVAEADSTIVSGANAAVDAMVVVMAELRTQVKILHEEAEALRQENRELRRQVTKLQREVARLQTKEN